MALLESSEPRPVLTDYVLTKYGSKVTSALPVLYWKKKDEKKTLLYECESYEKPSRVIRMLEGQELSSFKERFEGMRTDFMVFHILFKDKDACVPRMKGNVNQKKESPRHGIMLLYNKRTHRLYRYDILRYHYRGFKSHLFGKRLKSAFIPWLQQFDPEVKLVDVGMVAAKRVVKYLAQKMGSEPSIKVWYPLYVLLELDTMLSHPELLKTDLQDHMMAMSEEALSAKLDHLYFAFGKFLMEFYETYNTCVAKSRIVDPAKLTCVDATSRRAQIIKGISKVCDNGKVLSLYNRCVKSKMYDHFNVRGKGLVDTPNEEKFIKVGSLMGNTIALMYLTTKFKNAAVFIPPRMRWEALRKEDLRFTWRYDAEDGWNLGVPEGFEAFWEKTIGNKKIDQILIPVSLTSKPKADGHIGFHANILIYNKLTKELEHFEPHGIELSKEPYNPDGLYDAVRKVFKDQFQVKKYASPIQVCPKNMQFFQSVETDEVGFLNDHGHCAVWCLWYADVRLANPTIPRADVIRLAMQKMLDMGSLRMFIWNYEKHFAHMLSKLSGFTLGQLKKPKVMKEFL